MSLAEQLRAMMNLSNQHEMYRIIQQVEALEAETSDLLAALNYMQLKSDKQQAVLKVAREDLSTVNRLIEYQDGDIILVGSSTHNAIKGTLKAIDEALK